MMRRSYEYSSPRNQHGWDTTSHDYHDHVSRIERMPSVLTDVPHYPNVHKVFKRNVVSQEPQHNINQTHQHNKQNQSLRFQDKVEVIEDVQDSNENRAVNYEEGIDSEADGFIKRKHKGFQMCKWSTFRVR